MQRRALQDSKVSLGTSTSCLLTFQNDMLGNLSIRPDDNSDFDKMSRTKTNDCKTRSFTANHRLRNDDGLYPASRTKSGSSASLFEMTSASSKNATRCKNDMASVSSVSTASHGSTTSKSSSFDEDIVSRSSDFQRPPCSLQGRSRPGLRKHRSGSFALRQFKENYNQNQTRHSKTKAEARAKASMNNDETTTTMPETRERLFENLSDWKKPTLRSHRSMDVSFRVQNEVPTLHTTSRTTSDRTTRVNGRETGTTKFDRNVVEVAPGCSMLFCGIEESMHALHLDRIVHVECTSCSTFLACINIATMVLCPGCQTVSPSETPNDLSTNVLGVPTMGIGLRVEDILAHIGK